MRLTAQRRWVIPVSVLTAGLVAFGVVGLVKSSDDQPRAREYTSSRACLLTDASGVAAEPASTVWQAMQAASSSTHAQVTFQSMAPGSTTAEALPYLNGMIEQSCGVIVTVGDNEIGAAEQAAGTNPTVHFIIVGPAAKSAANVKRLPSGANLRGQIKSAVQEFTSS